MPKKALTTKGISKLLREARVNRKSSKDDFGNIQKRRKFKDRPKDSEATVVNRNLLLSNREEVETNLVFDSNREYYNKASFTETFDTEVVQLVTPRPPIEPDPDPVPPPAPKDLRIDCTNEWWTLDGKKGRTEKDKPSWHRNIHPKGNNPGGGYLIIPGDHPLFYIHTLEPKDARGTFNYEWTVDGNVVGNGPSFHMFNASDQGKLRDDDDDKMSYWQDQDDIIIECRVWNESGEIKEKTKMRCAKRVRNSDHLEADGKTPIPSTVWRGTRYAKDDNFLKGKWPYYTDYVIDEKYKPRLVRCSRIRLKDYNTSNFTNPARYNAKPWTPRQIPSDLKVVPDYVTKKVYNYYKRGFEEVKTRTTSASRRKEKQRRYRAFDKAVTRLIDKECNPYDDPNAFVGRVYINGIWVTFKEFWSGYDVKDVYDLQNFLRFKKDGTHHISGTSLMDKENKYIESLVNVNDTYEFGLIYGYAKVVKGNQKIYRLVYSEKTKGRVTQDSKEKQFSVSMNLASYDVIYYNDDTKKTETKLDAKDAQRTNNKFTKSTAQRGKFITRGGRGY